jgi:hypothetical protein
MGRRRSKHNRASHLLAKARIVAFLLASQTSVICRWCKIGFLAAITEDSIPITAHHADQDRDALCGRRKIDCGHRLELMHESCHKAYHASLRKKVTS